ncbi:hypothetical protein AXK11_04480 [Cephaloticoccus primus]|uniref:PIN domain-containing protein n=1 Tax=Cephaloticoccus primus TaxID=1548207 RepID=A0A139SPT8_9BACT|nr:PIN domain-containing protein [Cephaloticoccus primus]KXU36500.1 hypothetical protein AXK11_04480 [Cephaloticoccus primus]
MSTSLVTPRPLNLIFDANVLAYAALAKLLLGFARHTRLFHPCWSQQILDETWRTYAVKFGHGAQYATTRLAEITMGFPAALQSDLEPLIARCTNDPKDRHVLAAAIKAEAKVIVTFNQRHFAPEHLARWGITAMHPQDFLLELYAKDSAAVWHELKLAAGKKGMPTRDLLRSYSPQLDRFKAAILADLP